MENENLKSTRIFIDLVVLGLLLVANFALAANSVTVSATVTLQNVSVTVASGTVSYGTLAAGASLSTLTGNGGLGDTQTATNAGNVAEDFQIAGSNSADWTLGLTSNTDQYVHKFCTASCGTNTVPTNFTALTTGYTTLASNITASSGTQNFDLQITMPSSSTHFSSENVNVTVMATAH